MSTEPTRPARLRARWSAIGAAVAITFGAGGIGLAHAAVSSGDKPVTVTVDAKRILDTRTNVGLAGAFAKDTPRDVQVTGPVAVATASGTATATVVPAGATAVLVNVTVVSPSDQGFLTLRAGGAAGAPTTSTVNFQAGSVEPNAATVDLSADGKIQVWVFMPSGSARADVLIDVVGYTIDHNHDDRYYRKGQVDAALGAKANTADVDPSLDVYTGELAQHYTASEGFMIVGDSYPRPLPEGVDTPILEYLASGTSANCPGVGQAATPGVLCVYAYNNNNISSVSTSGQFGGANKRFGFALDIFPSTAGLGGYFLATWAYRVP